MEATVQAAVAGGMVVFAASGDNDSSDGGSTPANVDCPSSCPHAVGCGGTMKTPTDETVWNDNPGETDGEGTGGGYSTIFPVESFQIGAPPAPANTQYGKGRMVPDVCANADPDTGYNIFVRGSATIVGGTSAVAPLYAGLFAAFGTKLGFVTPTLWKNQKAFNDITVGPTHAVELDRRSDPQSPSLLPHWRELLSGGLDGLNQSLERRNLVHGIAEALPLIEAAAQRAHALDPQLVQLQGNLG
jgi:kumamolisin